VPVSFMKPKRNIPNTACIILIIVISVLAIGGSILFPRFEYMAGARNDAAYSLYLFFPVSMLFLIITPMALCCSIIALIRLISLVLIHSNIRQILFMLALLLLGPVIVCSAFFYITPLSPVFLKGFEQWVLHETDIDAIQTWLANEGAKYEGQVYSSKEDFPEDLPKFLVDLNPKYISFKNSASRNGPSITINWILFMDDYGLIIGPPDMETPQKGRIKLDRSTYEFRRPVKQGAYVFIRG
jgi:hypothetical protein